MMYILSPSNNQRNKYSEFVFIYSRLLRWTVCSALLRWNEISFFLSFSPLSIYRYFWCSMIWCWFVGSWYCTVPVQCISRIVAWLLRPRSCVSVIVRRGLSIIACFFSHRLIKGRNATGLVTFIYAKYCLRTELYSCCIKSVSTYGIYWLDMRWKC
jgi:hypothetical protein